MQKLLLSAERWLVRLEGLLILLAFAGLIGIMFLQVLYRFVLSDPLAFTEEISRICMIWLVFIGGARALYEAEHFIVDFVVNAMPARLAGIVGYLIDAVTIAFMVTLAWVGYRTSIFGAGQVMPALGISVAVQTIAMPIGFTMMLIHGLVFLVKLRHIGLPGSAPVSERDGVVHEPVGV